MIPKTCISVSNGFRYALEACLVNMGLPKTIYLFGCLRRSLVVSKVLATPMVPVESSRVHSLADSTGRFVFIPKSFGDHF